MYTFLHAFHPLTPIVNGINQSQEMSAMAANWLFRKVRDITHTTINTIRPHIAENAAPVIAFTINMTVATRDHLETIRTRILDILQTDLPQDLESLNAETERLRQEYEQILGENNIIRQRLDDEEQIELLDGEIAEEAHAVAALEQLIQGLDQQRAANTENLNQVRALEAILAPQLAQLEEQYTQAEQQRVALTQAADQAEIAQQQRIANGMIQINDYIQQAEILMNDINVGTQNFIDIRGQILAVEAEVREAFELDKANLNARIEPNLARSNEYVPLLERLKVEAERQKRRVIELKTKLYGIKSAVDYLNSSYRVNEEARIASLRTMENSFTQILADIQTRKDELQGKKTTVENQAINNLERVNSQEKADELHQHLADLMESINQATQNIDGETTRYANYLHELTEIELDIPARDKALCCEETTSRVVDGVVFILSASILSFLFTDNWVQKFNKIKELDAILNSTIQIEKQILANFVEQNNLNRFANQLMVAPHTPTT